MVFFVAVVFAALTSLVNLFEAPTATLQELFHLPRPAAVGIIGAIGIGVGLLIAPIVSQWMDAVSYTHLDVYKRQAPFRSTFLLVYFIGRISP